MTGGTHCGPILVVEDDDYARALLCDLLGQAGYDVHAATTGAEAVAELEQEQLSVAVLDVVVPDLSGYEICRRLRGRYGARIGVLFVSGERTEAVDRVAGLLIGGDDYLVKPFAPDELLARVGVLARRSEERHQPTPLLTLREGQVFELLARGLPNSEIARLLVISPKTVATHIEHIYGKLNPAMTKESGRVVAFDQAEFAAGSPYDVSLADIGYAYVPKSCESTRCKVHVAFHGCKQSAEAVGEKFVRHAGYNRWADSNGIIVLYPQTISRSGFGVFSFTYILNPNGCWDWWGYTGPEYHTHNGAQVRAVKAMVDRLMQPR